MTFETGVTRLWACCSEEVTASRETVLGKRQQTQNKVFGFRLFLPFDPLAKVLPGVSDSDTRRGPVSVLGVGGWLSPCHHGAKGPRAPAATRAASLLNF